MNLKILISLMTIGIATAGLGYGTFAFFSDTETSTENLFTAGDLDLTLDGFNGVTATITGANFAPGDSTTGSILLKNEGSIFTGDAEGHMVDLDLKAVTSVTDDLGNVDDSDDGGVSAVSFDAFLIITQLNYGAVDLLALIDGTSDGRAGVSLQDLMNHGVFADLADPGAVGETLSIAVTFDTAGGNDLKRDVVDLSFTFYLSQSGDADLS